MAPSREPPYGRADFCEHCAPRLDAILDWMTSGMIQGVLRRFIHPAFRRPAPLIDASITTPEDTLRDAGISTKRQAKYQRRMSSLLAGRE